jgi:hypothetical protein
MFISLDPLQIEEKLLKLSRQSATHANQWFSVTCFLPQSSSKGSPATQVATKIMLRFFQLAKHALENLTDLGQHSILTVQSGIERYNIMVNAMLNHVDLTCIDTKKQL